MLRIWDVYHGSASYNLSILTQKIVSKLSEIWSGLFIPDPGSDPDFLTIPDPESRGQKSIGSRITDPQHCPYLNTKREIMFIAKCSNKENGILITVTITKSAYGSLIPVSYYGIPAQCCESTWFWCLSGSGSDVIFWWRSKSGSGFYPKFYTFFYSSAVYIVLPFSSAS